MTERAASSTAVLVCQGRATADGRYAVGRFSDPIARHLLDPADRLVVDRVRADRVPTEAADRMAYEMVRRTGLTMVPRTISIDEAIRGHAAGQLVILGAGLDARAWRMSELARAAVFEVDDLASQQDKLLGASMFELNRGLWLVTVATSVTLLCSMALAMRQGPDEHLAPPEGQ